MSERPWKRTERYTGGRHRHNALVRRDGVWGANLCN